MENYKIEYDKLNKAQRQAVDSIEGPVLVVAGPGTGKTQLLAMRAANILRSTDVLPNNILCLTFTDSAARNMRERLESIIGRAAYHVNIHTFHSFGSEIINLYPDFYSDRHMIQPIDELGSYRLLSEIFETLPHSSKLSAKADDEFVFLNDTRAVIGYLKQNGLTAEELRTILDSNKAFFLDTSEYISKVFTQTCSPKYIDLYEKLHKELEKRSNDLLLFGFPNYGVMAADELRLAIDNTDVKGRYAKSITAWRSKWCEKDHKGDHVFKDALRNMNILELANIYEKYMSLMRDKGLYDFDDMIIEVVHAIEKHNELRLNLQERYQYIMVDEFQDTNKAQLRILTGLGDNTLFEGRPNIMAVGDDDQAIYAFQGAEVSNMSVFLKQYNNPKIVTLEENYRSTKQILDVSQTIVSQITNRLGNVITETDKKLVSQSNESIDSTVTFHQLSSELEQYSWLAEKIQKSIQNGLDPQNIAVIAPRHRYLERLVPYLVNNKIPVSYERRENILDAPIILKLLAMSKLVISIMDNEQETIDQLISEVLSYDFWLIEPRELVKISISCYNKHEHWLPTILNGKNTKLITITNWLISIARNASSEPLEYILDQLIGHDIDDLSDTFVSPMKAYYFGENKFKSITDEYLSLLGQLATLRQKLRLWRPDQTLYVRDLILFAELHKQSHIKIIDNNPHTQSTNAVQVMTAFKAKGLEFDTVYVINCQDEIWGTTVRNRSLKINLPKNIPVEPSKDNDNDRLRLFYVACTRAKNSLVLTGYTHSLENKLSPKLGYLIDDNGKPVHPDLEPKNSNNTDINTSIEILSTDWTYRFRQIIADKDTVLEPLIRNYKLSVTHLNNFTDVTKDGPQYFFIHNFLRFPQAPTPAAAFGNAIHESLQWTYNELKHTGKLPSQKTINAFFSDLLNRKHLRQTDYKRLQRRGISALESYITTRKDEFNNRDIIERGFNNEGVIINDAHLSGKIDKLKYDDNSGGLSIVDFKTGKPSTNWQGNTKHEKIKLHKYRQQLLFYNLLINGSGSFSNRSHINNSSLEFIESNEQGQLVPNLILKYEPEELEKFKKLIGAIWSHIVDTNYPAVDKYEKSLKGILSFEDDLINGKI